jgi:hypothetical protein
MNEFQPLDPMTGLVVMAALIIIGLTLFSKFIHFILKLAIIAVMVLCILYVLREAGVL